MGCTLFGNVAQVDAGVIMMVRSSDQVRTGDTALILPVRGENKIN